MFLLQTNMRQEEPPETTKKLGKVYVARVARQWVCGIHGRGEPYVCPCSLPGARGQCTEHQGALMPLLEKRVESLEIKEAERRELHTKRTAKACRSFLEY